MTMTTFKTTDFKVGDIVIYRPWKGAKEDFVLELLSVVDRIGYGLEFAYHIVVSPDNPEHNGTSDPTWGRLSANILTQNVVAKT
jgi:hypothetical protein